MGLTVDSSKPEFCSKFEVTLHKNYVCTKFIYCSIVSLSVVIYQLPLKWEEIRHTIVHHSSTSTYIPNFTGIGKTLWTDGRTDSYLRST